jgi:UDP-N-acetylmuramyl pentapeptide phosphotransferase/UDP-N-acetylglucosamine-1-phosphate transferase
MSDEAGALSVAVGATAAVVAAATSTALILALYPWLERYALAKPNVRSSHRTPTPQGGGIAVIAATVLAAWLALSLSKNGAAMAEPLVAICVAAVVMACLGATDDIHPLPVAPRLALQVLVVAGVIYALPPQATILAPLPIWVERLLLTLGGLWFVNLVNFMDGIDWMTVAEVIPVTAALVVIGAWGALPPYGIIVALALAGATVGFAYFNRPVARLFLGDVGSLPIGLILGWLLLLLAREGHLLAAVLMPLYYLADATLTLLRRMVGGASVFQAHREHFYQRATDRGFAVIQIVGRVFVVNLCLCVLAIMVVIVPAKSAHAAALLAAAALVAWLLHAFARGKT